MKSRRILNITITCVFLLVFGLLSLVGYQNPLMFKLQDETFKMAAEFFNALVFLTIPFLLGALAGFTRILLAGVKNVQNAVTITASGLMAMFSWIWIKSGVLLAIVAPHVEKQGLPKDVLLDSPSDFYAMALVAIVVGMFSSNFYILINQKVEQLTAQRRTEKPNYPAQTDNNELKGP